MRCVSAALLLLVPVVALADVDPKFARLRDDAEALASLTGFVDKYVGDCGPALLGGKECEKNAELYRKGATNKKYYLIITEDTSSVLQMGEMTRQGQFILNFTPFLAASRSAITHGAPLKADANGNPVLPFIRIASTLPDGWNPAMMARQVQARALRVQIVFTPLGLWTLPKKGGGTIKGIKARFDAVLVQVGRTGETVGLWTAK